VSVIALLASALGGGIVASLLQAWFAHLRAYETARLQVLDDLDSMNAMSQGLVQFGEGLTPAELERMRYPTETWSANRAVMATRLQRQDPDLLMGLSSLFSALTLTPLVGPLENELLANLPKLYARLGATTLGVLGSSIVYGPRYAIRQRGAAPMELETTAEETGEQTGEQA